jgi:ribonucleoside-diphosphate reductase alpha chain
VLCKKFSNSRFEPSGFTTNPEIPSAKSIMDYIFRWMEIKFLGGDPANSPKDFSANVFEVANLAGSGPGSASPRPTEPRSAGAAAVQTNGRGGGGFGVATISDAPICSDCGSSMIPNGACYRCANCGGTSGCS